VGRALRQGGHTGGRRHNKDLGEAVKAGRFREDLFYRSTSWPSAFAAARAAGDIPLLAEHFAARHPASGGLADHDAREALLLWDWPGNVRAGECGGPRARPEPRRTILPEDLPEAVRERWRPDRAVSARPPVIAMPPPLVAAPDPLIVDHPTLDELSRRYAERVLRDAGGNKTGLPRPWASIGRHSRASCARSRGFLLGRQFGNFVRSLVGKTTHSGVPGGATFTTSVIPGIWLAVKRWQAQCIEERS